MFGGAKKEGGGLHRVSTGSESGNLVIQISCHALQNLQFEYLRNKSMDTPFFLLVFVCELTGC